MGLEGRQVRCVAVLPPNAWKLFVCFTVSDTPTNHGAEYETDEIFWDILVFSTHPEKVFD